MTEWEDDSRQERHDTTLQEKCGIDCINMTTANKAVKLRSYHEKQYKLLTNAAYERRGWTRNCAPTMKKIKTLCPVWIH